MTFLPIVERELRVAARQPLAFLLRFHAALIATLFWLTLLGARSSATTPAGAGQTFFNIASVLLFIGCALSGVFLTADAISNEKRDGTLGLLFLTDLRGYDVVLGKLVSSSVRAAYALIGVFPVLALPLLLGGVTAGQFWRVVPALLITLYLSLAIGIAISAFARQSRTSMGATFLTVLLLAAVLPLLYYVIEDWPGSAHLRFLLLWPNPGFTLACALETPPNLTDYWSSMAVIVLLATAMLLAASLALPRVWQERSRSIRPARTAHAGARSISNPVEWLSIRQQPSALLVWGLLGAVAAVCAAFVIHSLLSPGTGRWMRSSFLLAFVTAFGAHQLVKYMIAAEASRRFNEDRASGAMELLLVTPLTPQQIIAGQRQALWHFARGPLSLCALLNVLLFLLLILKSPFGSSETSTVWQLAILGGILLLGFDYYALSWLGMWHGLTRRRHHRAVLHTLVRVMLPPWIAAFVIITTLGVGAAGVTYVLTFWFTISVIASVMSGQFALARLQQDFRRTVRAGVEAQEKPWEWLERMGKPPVAAHGPA
jgi:ABC-type transport system involved in cytochrome c biogenesis permease component